MVPNPAFRNAPTIRNFLRSEKTLIDTQHSVPGLGVWWSLNLRAKIILTCEIRHENYPYAGKVEEKPLRPLGRFNLEFDSSLMRFLKVVHFRQ
jgi:hypothetical protein